MGFRTERKREILRRRHRKMKLAKLKTMLAAATNKADKERIAAKIHRITPFLEVSAK